MPTLNSNNEHTTEYKGMLGHHKSIVEVVSRKLGTNALTQKEQEESNRYINLSGFFAPFTKFLMHLKTFFSRNNIKEQSTLFCLEKIKEKIEECGQYMEELSAVENSSKNEEFLKNTRDMAILYIKNALIKGERIPAAVDTFLRTNYKKQFDASNLGEKIDTCLDQIKLFFETIRVKCKDSKFFGNKMLDESLSVWSKSLNNLIIEHKNEINSRVSSIEASVNETSEKIAEEVKEKIIKGYKPKGTFDSLVQFAIDEEKKKSSPGTNLNSGVIKLLKENPTFPDKNGFSSTRVILKNLYKSMAMVIHPDKNVGDRQEEFKEKFKELGNYVAQAEVESVNSVNIKYKL